MVGHSISKESIVHLQKFKMFSSKTQEHMTCMQGIYVNQTVV